MRRRETRNTKTRRSEDRQKHGRGIQKKEEAETRKRE